MRLNHFILNILLFVLVCCPLNIFSQSTGDCDYQTICTPKIFTSQSQASFMYEIKQDIKKIEDYIEDSSSKPWVVYSDRANNKLKNDINGSNNGEKLDFMKACLVKKFQEIG